MIKMNVKIFGVILFNAMFLVDVYSNEFPPPFVKKVDSYEGWYEDGTPPETHVGYIETMSKLVDDYKQGKCEIEALNEFKNGLYEYFLLSLLEKTYWDHICKLPDHEIHDSISLPDYVDDEIAIKDVVASGFPALKHGIKPDLTHEPMSSATEYKATVTYCSDVTLFVGSFYLNGYKYPFVYDLKKSTYLLSKHMSRRSDAVISMKRAVKYDKEYLTHTYDSCYDDYAKIDTLFSLTLSKKYIPLALDYLSTKAHESIQKDILKTDLKHIATRRGQTLDAIVSSAKFYLLSKKLDTFEASPFEFSNTIGPKVSVQGCGNIKVVGCLHNAKAEITDTVISLSEDGKLANITSTIDFSYSHEAANEDAYVSFTLTNGKLSTSKKLKLLNITVTASYSANLKEKPLKLYRNKEAFKEGCGIYTHIKVTDYDLTYEAILEHIAIDMSKSIAKLLGD